MFSTNLNKSVLLLQLNTRLIKIEKEFPEVVSVDSRSLESQLKACQKRMVRPWLYTKTKEDVEKLLESKDYTRDQKEELGVVRKIDLKEEHTRLLTLHRMIHTSSDNNIPVDEDTYKFIFNSEGKG